MERDAKFKIGEIVKHKFLSFRGVIFDVGPTFNNTDEWWLSIPEEILILTMQSHQKYTSHFIICLRKMM